AGEGDRRPADGRYPKSPGRPSGALPVLLPVLLRGRPQRGLGGSAAQLIASNDAFPGGRDDRVVSTKNRLAPPRRSRRRARLARLRRSALSFRGLAGHSLPRLRTDTGDRRPRVGRLADGAALASLGGLRPPRARVVRGERAPRLEGPCGPGRS